ncbi:hypothetical protein KFL_004570050 [Klebsormidium nitens]|uniref:Uncharacterized protein n=1 Tax=Klebsormidium nitens TaxID=105231 RepID=A0A1Y1IDV3_KLENI|nr:hypothetical protein KFL_004570050 [Klebsormidium nitens]|eukprot:GAQ88763.1 hypothetical protein KFL_004570050 [Klebsormidium nitens]
MASCLAASSARSALLVGQSSRAPSTENVERGLLFCNCRSVLGPVGSSAPASSRLQIGGHRVGGGPLYQNAQRTRKSIVRAEAVDKPSGGSGKFLTGFLIGGVVLGVLGFFFAPQISKTLLGENEDGSPRRLPRWLDEEDSLEATRRSLNEKIAQLNAAIDDVSAQLRADETADEELETSL